MQIINDTFSDTAGTALASHTPDTGTAWTVTIGTNAKISAGGTLYYDSTAEGMHYATPHLTEDQNTITYDLVVKASATKKESPAVGVIDYTGGGKFQVFSYDGVWYLRGIATATDYDTYAQELSLVTTYHVEIVYDSVTGDCDVSIDGVLRMSATVPTGGNSVCVHKLNALDASTGTTGMHIDNLSVDDGTGGGGGATTYTMVGASASVALNKPLTLTFTPDGNFTGTITPDSDGAGAFSPTSQTWAGNAVAKTITYTPSSAAGSPHTISATNDGGITDPADVDVTVDVVNVVVGLGDSITVNVGVTPTYLEALQDALGPGWAVFNKGVGGQTLGDMKDRIDTDVIPLLTGPRNIVVLLGGVNDISPFGLNVSAATAFASLVDCVQEIIDQAVAAPIADFDVVVGTLGPSTDATFNSRRATFASLIRGAAISDRLWTAVADHAFDLRYAADAKASDATLYPDGGHPSALVTPMMASTVAAVISTVVHPAYPSPAEVAAAAWARTGRTTTA